MTIETSVPRSRRALLTAVAAAGAAAIASALGRPLPVRADQDDVVHAGQNHTADQSTSFNTGNHPVPAIRGESVGTVGVAGGSFGGTGTTGSSFHGSGVKGNTNSDTNPAVIGEASKNTGVQGFSGTTNPPASPLKTGVYGTAAPDAAARGVWGKVTSGQGVRGDATSGIGVVGKSTSGTGVSGNSATGSGVLGLSSATGKPAIVGTSTGQHSGVQGYSGPLGGQPAAPVKTGVFGYAAIDAAARGVVGQTTAGHGVRGVATTGIGVSGYATSGPAGSFESVSGFALQSSGRLSFGKSSGRTRIASGASSVTVPVGLDLTASTFAVATLNSSPGGTTSVQRVGIDPTANTLTIYLTASTGRDVEVAWLVMG